MKKNQKQFEANIEKYKTLYLQSAQFPKEQVAEVMAELKTLRNENQLQKDKLIKASQKEQAKDRKIQKFKHSVSDLQQKLEESKNQLKSAIQSRDHAIGEKYIFQKKYETLLSNQQVLQTEPAEHFNASFAMETEENGFDDNDQLKSQLENLEKKFVEMKLENNSLKMQLDDYLYELDTYKKTCQMQKEALQGFRKGLEMQAKSGIQVIKSPTTQLNPQEASQEEQLKKLIHEAESRSKVKRPISNSTELNQQILEKQIMNQIKFQQVMQEPKEQKGMYNLELSDFSDMVLRTLNVSPTNHSFAKQRIEKYFGNEFVIQKKNHKWF